MAGLDDLLKALPLDQLAGSLGVDADTAQSAVGGLLPAIFGGLQANAADPAGAASLGQALAQHSGGLVDGGVSLDDVDTDDGAKIAAHIFGSQQDQVVAKVAETTGASSGLLQKLLPALAPIAMSFLSKQLASKAQGSAVPEATGQDAGGIGGVLGSILGGGSGGSGAQGGGFDIGSILGGLGGLLGGGRR
ncbi:DUF937 domain-containing protein [Xylanimonas ulmi]|uniref:Uncharacterized protein DUF937 n=1 Tax=Xylanimonas ulmi TaxID=228973 RepID=A0A4Q7M677_9MICO|nr:DUF937 domain-containing protein [Xylanibacterium ulmi]RZS63174.1 uncharacterized protein DUF937 [Xylanibacterium ulmi]